MAVVSQEWIGPKTTALCGEEGVGTGGVLA